MLSATDYYVDDSFTKANTDDFGETKFALIQEALEKAMPGDTIWVADGIYRELIQPVRSGEEGQPITIAAWKGHSPVIRGTDPLNGSWRVESVNGARIYKSALPAKMFEGYSHPWMDKIQTPENPFHSKIIISSIAPKGDVDGLARPWDADQVVASDDENAKVSFDTDTRKVNFDGPPNTLPRTLGQVFVDDAPLTQAVSLENLSVSPDSFLVSPNGEELWINLRSESDINESNVEITTRAQCVSPIRRGISHIVLRGLTFERAANQGPFPQAGMVSSRSGSYWLIEDCTIRYATTAGIDCGGETYLNDSRSGVQGNSKRTSGNIIRNCTISDNGLSGIASYGTRGLLIEQNVFERNNRLEFIPGLNASWWEMGAVKLHIAPGAVIRNNLVRNNEGFGIWIDTGYAKVRITGNTIVSNKLGGVFGEASSGPLLIDNNIIAYTRSGHGIYLHDGSDAFIANNLTFRNSGYGVFLRNVRPMSSKYETSNNTVFANMLLGDYYGSIALPMNGKKNADNHSDWNILSGGSHFYDNGPVRMGLHSRERGFYESLNLADGNFRATEWKDEDLIEVSLEAWRSLTGNDINSIAPFNLQDKYMGLRSIELNFELDIPEAMAGFKPKIEVGQVYGDRLESLSDTFTISPGSIGAFAGPFGELKSGRRILSISPFRPSLESTGR